MHAKRLRVRFIIPILVAFSYLSPLAAQQVFPNPSAFPSPPDFSETVIPIGTFKVGIDPKISYKPKNPLSYIDVQGRSESGTGFCIDPVCRFIGTNYHVAVTAQPRKIEGQKIIEQYLATGPDDEGAAVLGGLTPMKYNLSRDLAIFELGRPLSHHHGVAYHLDGLDDGQEVEIYAYPKESNPIRRLLQFHGRYKGETTTGLLAFEYSSAVNKTIRPGASGGIVVDRNTQRIVGILTGVARNDEALALAVPVQSLVEFVTKVQPYLADNIFPHRANAISPLSADLYPKVVLSPSDGLQRRPEESSEVKLLRSKAQALADNMRNFIAVQTFAWGSGSKEPAAEAAYEVQVIDGFQRFREYPDGKKELRGIPLPALSNVFVPGGEWSELPQWVGTELNLRIRQMPDAAVNGRHTKVFQYQASAEDGLCKWDIGVDYGFFARSKIFDAAVYGEVWTDEDMNIRRISEHCEIPETFQWKDYWAVVTYGWLKRADEPPRLIPLTIYTQAGHKKRIYWCRGQFTGYQMFSTRARVVGK